MKPVIKHNVAFFYPVGFLDGGNALAIVSPHDIDYLLSIKPSGAFISLSKVSFFNKRGLSTLIDYLSKLSHEYGAMIGFCDYKLKKYTMIHGMFSGKLNFSLFDSAAIALLYLGDDLTLAKEKKIIVFSKENDQKGHLSMELYERGYEPIIAKDEDEFLALKNDCEFVVENSYFANFDKTHIVYIKDNVIVYGLEGYVDSNISKTFDARYHRNSLKIGFKLFVFDATHISFINIHGINFISKLSISAAEYGATIAICGLDNKKILDKLLENLEDAGVMIYPDLKAFFEDDDMIKDVLSTKSAVKISKGITKSLIETLPLITEESVKTIEVLSGYNASKKSINVQSLVLDGTKDMISASIGFFGDINGVLILIFEKSIAKKACRILLEDNSDEHEIVEALGEFIHIIGGKISHELQKKGISIDITMPRTFASVNDIVSSQKDIRGAQIDLDIDGQPLILFLTK